MRTRPAVGTWWAPGPVSAQAHTRERVNVLTALHGASRATALATEHEDDWSGDRPVWAMRLLQALDGVEEEIRYARRLLVAAGFDEGLSLREIAVAAGVSHASVRTWVARASSEPTGPPSRCGSHTQPRWTLTDPDVAKIASEIEHAEREAGRTEP